MTLLIGFGTTEEWMGFTATALFGTYLKLGFCVGIVIFWVRKVVGMLRTSSLLIVILIFALDSLLR